MACSFTWGRVPETSLDLRGKSKHSRSRPSRQQARTGSRGFRVYARSQTSDARQLCGLPCALRQQMNLVALPRQFVPKPPLSCSPSSAVKSRRKSQVELVAASCCTQRRPREKVCYRNVARQRMERRAYAVTLRPFSNPTNSPCTARILFCSERPACDRNAPRMSFVSVRSTDHDHQCRVNRKDSGARETGGER